MLNTVQRAIQEAMHTDVSFAQKYIDYTCAIQDMDIDNEILPLIKQESTEYVSLQKKLARARKRNLRKTAVDFKL